MALVLSERGFGTVEQVLHTRVDLAVEAWHYVKYQDDYAATESAMNQKET